MRNFKGFAFGLVLGIGLAVSGLGFAQNAQPDQKKAESCCAMTSCCCKGDSCDKMKHDAKEHSGGCCCCGGDSCEMKKHETDEKPKS